MTESVGLFGRLFACPVAREETPHETRRRHILAAARRCFSKSGFHGASMQEVCAEAKMSPGALYRYFRSKDEMIEAIAEEERINNLQLFQALEGEGDLLDRLAGLAMTFLTKMTDEGAAALCAEIYSEAIRNSAIGERFLANEREVRALIHAFLSDKAARGEIRPVDDLDTCIGFVSAAMDGLVVRMAIDPSLTPEAVRPFVRGMLGAVFGLGEAAQCAPFLRGDSASAEPSEARLDTGPVLRAAE